MAISHQLVFVLQSVLEQGPNDWLQLRVRGQQVGAEHFQPCVGQPVHCRHRMSDSSAFIRRSKKVNSKQLKALRIDRRLTFLIEETERV